VLTSSIVLVMIVNTVAASTAAFVALLASAVDPSHRVATTDVAPDSRFPQSPAQHDRGRSPKERFLWLCVPRPAGGIRNHNDEPDELLRRMT
jgi:hypothetical protein